MRAPPGVLIIPLEGLDLSAADRRRLAHSAVGGVILFDRNYCGDKARLRRLVAEVKEVLPGALVSVDHEGGRVQRFTDGFTAVPPMGRLGEVYERDAEQALHAAERRGLTIARELRDVGINVNYAPVLDLGVNRSVIGDRAYHSDLDAVYALARAFIAGQRAGGLPSVGKHFPGHGSVEGDTHTDVVRDPRSADDIKANDLSPYRRLIEDGELDAVMTAHVIYGDDEAAATFSRAWLHTVLRTEMGFQGAVFSDDLTMHAAKVGGGVTAVAARALEAGCDLLLVCGFEATDELLATWDEAKAVFYTERMTAHWRYDI